MTIHAMEVMPDHVHLFVDSYPRWSPAKIAARLAGSTSHTLRSEFAHLRSRVPTLWSRSYFMTTGGSVDAAGRNDIERQTEK